MPCLRDLFLETSLLATAMWTYYPKSKDLIGPTYSSILISIHLAGFEPATSNEKDYESSAIDHSAIGAAGRRVVGQSPFA